MGAPGRHTYLRDFEQRFKAIINDVRGTERDPFQDRSTRRSGSVLAVRWMLEYSQTGLAQAN